MAKFKYQEALNRLEQISQILESEVKDINVLADLVKESAKLVKQCKSQLKNTMTDIEETLDGMDEPLA